jgi:nitric oxide reductase subunit B
MEATDTAVEHFSSDKISNVLKWILLITAILCFIVVIWGTFKTYQLAPPLPQQFLSPFRTSHHDSR